MKFAVIKTGGKQYLVSPDTKITVDKLEGEKGAEVEFDALLRGDSETNKFDLGTPVLKEKVKGTIIETGKGKKIRVARFKAKVRYRKVTGFRPHLSTVKIVSI